MAWRVGIDVGGTFTDLAAFEARSGRSHFRKIPSTPDDPARATGLALAGLAEVAAAMDVAFFAHGTTAGTNALIEHTGARTGLITTDGFRDLLEIGRQQRPDLYDLRARKPVPLVPRRRRREVPERLAADGSVLRPLDLDAVERELAYLAGEEIGALAVCCLHSYVNPEHERAVAELARRLLPGVYVTASCDLLPRFREYERLSTTVVNAYLGPLMDGYLNEVERRAAAAGWRAPPHIMQSSGGLAPLADARREPVTTVLSGPAAGAAAAADLCTELSLAGAISIDMGGTSTDVCLTGEGSEAPWGHREVAGYAIDVPAADVHCVGAGGGSIVSVEAGGLPRVGPASAGARPGPACYGLGGTLPTLTDAFWVLGRLPAGGLLGGDMPLDGAAAVRYLRERVAAPLGLTVERAAQGAVDIAVANVRAAVEVMTIRRGLDPREYALIAAGGAGPLIACEVAEELGMPEVLVPIAPGAFSARGLLVGSIRRDWVQTRLLALTAGSLPALVDACRHLDGQARAWLGAHSPGGGSIEWRATARYTGQDYELPIDLPIHRRQWSPAALQRTFHSVHNRRYGFFLADHPVEIVDLIVSATAVVGPARPRVPVEQSPAAAGSVGAAGGDRRDERLPRCDRSALASSSVVEGPALITEYDSTTYVSPGWHARAGRDGVLRVRRGAAP